MHRKSLLSLFMLSMGVALLVAATMVGVASAKTASSGNLVITQAGAQFDSLDPANAYVSNDWGLMYNTELTLLNFPTKAGDAGTKLIPQAATAFPTISNGGKTYTFKLRSGLKLSNGSPVTAANFQRAFERNISPKTYAQFGVYDGLDVFLVGGQAFAETGKYHHAHNGSCGAGAGSLCTMNPPQHIAGITAGGLTLTIKLTQVVPQFASIMGMPWFQAVPTSMPYVATVGGVATYASGGPYFIAKNQTNYTLLKRNTHWPTLPFFKSNWPANPLTMVVKSAPNSSGSPELLQAEKNQVDLAGVNSIDTPGVISKYGVNKVNGQFHVGPTTCITWNVLNNQSANNATDTAANRKALNYAMSRNTINSYAGPLAGTPSEQILVPAIPGYRHITYYGGTGSLTNANNVPGQHLSGKDFNIYYRASSPYQTAVAEYVQQQANHLGMHPHLVHSTPGLYYVPLQTKSTATGPGGYNITASGGWCADYEDGYDYFNVNFDGRTIGDTGNTDYMYFNNARSTRTWTMPLRSRALPAPRRTATSTRSSCSSTLRSSRTRSRTPGSSPPSACTTGSTARGGVSPTGTRSSSSART